MKGSHTMVLHSFSFVQGCNRDVRHTLWLWLARRSYYKSCTHLKCSAGFVLAPSFVLYKKEETLLSACAQQQVQTVWWRVPSYLRFRDFVVHHLKAMFKFGWEDQAHADGETLKTKIVYLLQEKETAGPISLSGRQCSVAVASEQRWTTFLHMSNASHRLLTWLLVSSVAQTEKKSIYAALKLKILSLPNDEFTFSCDTIHSLTLYMVSSLFGMGSSVVRFRYVTVSPPLERWQHVHS